MKLSVNYFLSKYSFANRWRYARLYFILINNYLIFRKQILLLFLRCLLHPDKVKSLISFEYLFSLAQEQIYFKSQVYRVLTCKNVDMCIQHCAKIPAKILNCTVCGVSYHELCTTKAKCFVQFGDAVNPENTIMCRLCQSKLLEVSLNATMLNNYSFHMEVQTSDTSTQQNNSAIEICSKMSEILDSKLTTFKEEICNKITEEVSKLKVVVDKNTEDIK